MGLNPHQQSYLDSLLKLKPEEKCGCGWKKKEECRTLCHSRDKQKPDDKLFFEGYQAASLAKEQKIDRMIKFIEDAAKQYGSGILDPSKREEVQNTVRMFANGVIYDLKNKNRIF